MEFNRPTLLLDKEKCLANITDIVNRIESERVIFRPHFKTHQSAEIGSWFKELGVSKITVSSVRMAQYFSSTGWSDVFIAIPVNILEIEEISKLARKITLHLAVDSIEAVKYLSQNLKFRVGIYIKIDTGYHRTGIKFSDTGKINDLIDIIKQSDNLDFTGFFTHSGNTYATKDRNSIIEIYQNSINELNYLKSNYISDFPNILSSIGDTPSISVLSDFENADEIRPGNFVFYDVMQYFLGSCKFEDIAVRVACPVISKNVERNEIVIYGGAVHLSKESFIDKDGNIIYGLVNKMKGDMWDRPIKDTYVSSLSQEHGIIKTSTKVFNEIEIGDILFIAPVHSCLTANLYGEYHLLNGEKISRFRSL